MKKYHKIQTVFKRDPINKFKTLLMGEYSTPEIEYLANSEWIFTEKIDGTNIRVGWDGKRVTFGGKTDNSQIPARLYDELSLTFPAQMFESQYPDTPMTLYGEGYGYKIQKVGKDYIPDGCDFILFDISIGEWWLMDKDVAAIGEKLDLDIVPTVGRGTINDAIRIIRGGFSSSIGTAQAEGLVMRPAIELTNRRGDRIITKLKYKDFAQEIKP